MLLSTSHAGLLHTCWQSPLLRPCQVRCRRRQQHIPKAAQPAAKTLQDRRHSRQHHERWQLRAADTEAEVDVEEEAMEKFEKTIESVQRSFTSIRTGRASPSMLDRVEVEYYGAPTPLRQLATISVPESTTLVVQPFDKSAMGDIERALAASDLGVTPNNDGKVIRLKIPALTADRRKEMTKVASRYGEDGKVALRNVRRDAMKLIEKLEKDKAISEDDQASLEQAVQDLTDDYVKQVDKLIKAKQDELTKL